MSCRHLNRGAGPAPAWRLALCPHCRKARRVDAQIGFALLCRRAEIAPAEGLARILAALDLPQPPVRTARVRLFRALRRARKPAAILFAGSALLSYAWARYIEIDPDVAIPPPALSGPNAFQDFAVARSQLREIRLVEQMLSQRLHDIKVAGLREKGASRAAAPSPVLSADSTSVRHRYTASEMQTVVALNGRAMEMLRSGLSHGYAPPRPKEFSENPVYATSYRDLANVLVLDAALGEASGDWDRAAGRALDVIAFGNLTARGTSFDRILALGRTESGRAILWRILKHTDANLARAVARRLELLDGSRSPLVECMIEQKWHDLTRLQILMRDPDWRWRTNVFGSDLPVAAQWAWYGCLFPYSKGRLMRELRNIGDVRIALARDAFVPAFQRQQLGNAQNSWTAKLFESLSGVHDDVWFRDTLDSAQARLLMLSYAIRAYRLEHGRYPVSLSSLTPGYINAVPNDPFAQSQYFSESRQWMGRAYPIGYRLYADSYVLWSIGPDLLNQNGMQVMANKGEIARVVEECHGDIVAGVNVD